MSSFITDAISVLKGASAGIAAGLGTAVLFFLLAGVAKGAYSGVNQLMALFQG